MSGEGADAATWWARLGRRKLVRWALDFLMRNGQPERALRYMLEDRIDNVAGVRLVLWNAAGSATRRSPEFPEYARKLGFAELWDAYGPPDACRRIAPLAYRCD